METRDIFSSEMYLPSNGTEGEIFFRQWCDNCAHDAERNGTKEWDECGDDDFCPIIAAAFNGHVEQWIYKDGEPTCTEFCPIGCTPKCKHTIDLPLGD